jgi:hypothetical protein
MENYQQIIEEAQRVLEESRKRRQYYESPLYRCRMKRLYRNRRAMKKIVRKHEGRFAAGLATLEMSEDCSRDLSNIESVMEWFLTWRLNLEDYPAAGWCDGVQNLELTPRDKRTYDIRAKIWTGPVNDLRIQYLCDLLGTMTLSQNRRRLKTYRLEIDHEGDTYLIRKAT